MKHTECKDCKLSEYEDCGYHHRSDGVVNYDIPSLSACDQYGNCMFFQPKAKAKRSKWIPVSERLPDDLEPVNITWINHEPEPYYKEIKDKPFTATGVYFNGQWYWWSAICTDILAAFSHNYDDVIDTAIEVVAWQPLPEPYREGGAEG